MQHTSMLQNIVHAPKHFLNTWVLEATPCIMFMTYPANL